MQKNLMLLWIMLIIYAALHLIFFSMSSIHIVDLMFMNEDPMIFMMFNFLGIFPFAFLLFTIKYQVVLKTKHKIGLGLGFVSGAFSLYPTLTYLSYNNKAKKTNLTTYGSVVSMIMVVVLLFYGLFFGSFSNYFYHFLNDSLVQIMTIDFIFLYILSIHLMHKKTKKWYFTFIPLVGFLFNIYE
ncbi:MAG: hypothetical protein KKH92_03465 [Firmicutes bacterium]|nr:hypothetical protein [Bacillota bacterium]